MNHVGYVWLFESESYEEYSSEPFLPLILVDHGDGTAEFLIAIGFASEAYELSNFSQKMVKFHK